MDNIEKIKNEICLSLTSGWSAAMYEDVGKIGDISVRYYEYEDELERIDMYLGTYYIPLKYMYTVDKCLTLFCLRKHKEILFDAIKKYQDDLFSQDYIDYIHGRISEDLHETYHITMDSSLVNYDILYAMTEKNKLNLAAKQTNTIKFDEKTEYDIICTRIDKTKPSVFYGTLIDNKIVSLAELECCSDEELAHVAYVCTHKDYRNKGYAISNIVALAEDMLNCGKIITYESACNNTASQKTALTSGLSEIGKLKLYWFKKE